MKESSIRLRHTRHPWVEERVRAAFDLTQSSKKDDKCKEISSNPNSERGETRRVARGESKKEILLLAIIILLLFIIIIFILAGFRRQTFLNFWSDFRTRK